MKSIIAVIKEKTGRKRREKEEQKASIRRTNAELKRLLALPEYKTPIPSGLTPLEKAKEIQRQKDELKLCLDNGICPACGNGVSKFVSWDSNEWHPEDYYVTHCDICNIKFGVEVDIGY